MGVETILTMFWVGVGVYGNSVVAMTSQEYKTADACNGAGISLMATPLETRGGKLRYECTDKYTGELRTRPRK